MTKEALCCLLWHHKDCSGGTVLVEVRGWMWDEEAARIAYLLFVRMVKLESWKGMYSSRGG